MNATAQEILNFWFGPLSGPKDLASEKAPIWFSGGPELDAQISARFGDHLAQLKAQAAPSLGDSPKERLALVILFDQLSRNIHRGSKEAFEADHITRALTIEMIDAGQDQALYPIERVFLYLPLEHSERLSDQLLCLKCMERLTQSVTPEQRATFENYTDYAQQHLEIIERFGRFPHRNGILGRTSTPEEREYMADGGRSFGQDTKK